jgi:hypothetical protein
MPKNDKNPVKSKPGLKQGLESLQETGNFNIQNWKPIAYSPDLQVTRPEVVGYPQIPSMILLHCKCRRVVLGVEKIDCVIAFEKK